MLNYVDIRSKLVLILNGVPFSSWGGRGLWCGERGGFALGGSLPLLHH